MPLDANVKSQHGLPSSRCFMACYPKGQGMPNNKAHNFPMLYSFRPPATSHWSSQVKALPKTPPWGQPTHKPPNLVFPRSTAPTTSILVLVSASLALFHAFHAFLKRTGCQDEQPRSGWRVATCFHNVQIIGTGLKQAQSEARSEGAG